MRSKGSVTKWCVVFFFVVWHPMGFFGRAHIVVYHAPHWPKMLLIKKLILCCGLNGRRAIEMNIDCS